MALLVAMLLGASMGSRRLVLISAVAGVLMLPALGTVVGLMDGNLLARSSQIQGFQQSPLRVGGAVFVVLLFPFVLLGQIRKRLTSSFRQQQRALEEIRDELDRQEQEERTRRSTETALLAAQQLETLGRLSVTLAHEYSNQLLVIMVLSDALQSSDDEAFRADALRRISRAAEQGAQLSRTLLGVKPHADTRGVCSLEDVVRGFAVTLQRMMPEDITVSVEGSAPGAVSLGEGGLEQVLLNLCLNARDAMDSGGRITISVAPAGERLRVVVRDTGAGVSPAVQARLFEPQFTTKGARGSGLGLVAVRALIEQAGGSVSLESEEGVGTVVTLLIPRAPAPPVSLAAPATSGLAGRVVLIVEARPEVRRLLIHTLERARCQVLAADHAEEALQLLRRHRGDVHALCADITPGIERLVSGYRGLFPGGRVVLLSRGSLTVRPVDGCAVLTKPFSSSSLVGLLAASGAS